MALAKRASKLVTCLLVNRTPTDYFTSGGQKGGKPWQRLQLTWARDTVKRRKEPRPADGRRRTPDVGERSGG